MFASFACFALPSAQARDATEPYQFIDIRMEDGLKSAAVTEHVSADASGPMFSAGFLDFQSGRGLDKIASAVAVQHVDSATVSNMLGQIHNA